MTRPSPFPLHALRSLWANRSLAAALIRRDVIGRYKGSAAGLLWSFFNPVFMLAVYTFFFSVVFQAKWGRTGTSKTEFALIAFSGLIVFNMFVECITRAPSLVLSNPSYVKKVVFPLEILPYISMGSALFHFLVSFSVWLLFYTVFFGLPHWSALLLPVVMLPLILFTLGISWILASLGVYLRDVTQVVAVISGALIFLSPVFFPIESMPEHFQILLHLNPLTPAIELTRDVLIFGKGLAFNTYALFFAAGAATACVGFAWFQKTRAGFADVM